jgi:hypothetical protein
VIVFIPCNGGPEIEIIDFFLLNWNKYIAFVSARKVPSGVRTILTRLQWPVSLEKGVKFFQI